MIDSPGAGLRGHPAVAILLLSCLAAACDSGGGGGGSPTTPDDVTLALTVAPSSIGANGSAEVRVQAARGGVAPPGIGITLATTLGRLEATTLTTDANGRASTLLRGEGTSGVARVTARASGAAETSAEVRIGLDRNLALSVQPPTLAGSQTANVTVALFEASGAPAPGGVFVTLTTTLGRLTASQVTLDTQGTGRTTLSTNGQVGTARLTATATGVSAIADAVLRPAYSLSLEANPSTLATNGVSTLTARAIALDPAAPVGNLTLQLVTSLGRLQAAEVRTNAAGTATTELAADGRPGVATVTAVVAGATAEPATVSVTIN